MNYSEMRAEHIRAKATGSGAPNFSTGELDVLFSYIDAQASEIDQLTDALKHLMHNIKASGKRIDLGLALRAARAALNTAKAEGALPDVAPGQCVKCGEFGAHGIKAGKDGAA